MADLLITGGVTTVEAGAYVGLVPYIGELLEVIAAFGGSYAEQLGAEIAARNDVAGSKGVRIKIGLGSPHWYIPPYPGYYEITPRLKAIRSLEVTC